MGIDKLSVFTVVLHTCSHATPHGFVGSRVVTVMTRTGWGEIHIAAMLGMLRREDVVKGSQFVEVGIACLWVTAVHILCQLQHIVGVTGLRTVDVVDEVRAGFLAGEVLAA